MSDSSISTDKVEKCMLDAVSKSDNKDLDKEDEVVSAHNIYKVPILLINEDKYQGGWYSHNIFEALCTDYLSYDPQICQAKNPTVANSTGIGSIIIIVICIFLILTIIVYFYKRTIERSLDDTIAEKIKKQAQGSLGQYHIFQDRENSVMSKGIDVVKK